ncbi:DUF4197 family protein [Sphingomonas solaris]|nr:DUF4197 family protein [Sphingomonas solaris]
MNSMIDRRRLLGWAALMPVAGLAACVGGPTGYSVEEGVRRLLTLSTRRAFARLLQPNGFYDEQLARIAPPQGAGNGIAGGRMSRLIDTFMRSDAVRRRVALALNAAAGEAAERAAPIVLDGVRSLSPADAVRVLRGGPEAATGLLRERVGGQVVETMVPELSGLLRNDLVGAMSAAVAEETGIDYLELGRTVANQAADGIFRVIGREEAAIRADPAATRDPVLIALLGPGRSR